MPIEDPFVAQERWKVLEEPGAGVDVTQQGHLEIEEALCATHHAWRWPLFGARSLQSAGRQAVDVSSLLRKTTEPSVPSWIPGRNSHPIVATSFVGVR